jgi:hypothetical protein
MSERSRAYKNYGYDPYFTRSDIEERCGVCGQLNVLDSTGGIAATSEPVRFGGISITSTGTVAPLWLLDGDDPGTATAANHPGVDNLSTKDIEYVPTASGGCCLGGSGNWRNASGPGGNAPRI